MKTNEMYTRESAVSRFLLTTDARAARAFGIYILVIPALALFGIGVWDYSTRYQTALFAPLGGGVMSIMTTVVLPILLMGYVALKLLGSIRILRWTYLPSAWAGLVAAFIVAYEAKDISPAGITFFLIPPIYVAYGYRRGPAILTWAMTIALHSGLAASLLPRADAFVQSTSFACLLTVVVVVLQSAAGRTQRMRERLQEIIDHDALTGALQRRPFADSGTNILADYPLHPGHALAITDIDNFKDINDTYGHLAGDEVLVAVANVISEISPRGSLLCRLGGDEFAVLWPNTSHIEAEARVRHFHRALSHVSVAAKDRAVTVQASMGWSHFPSQAATLSELYEYADDQLLRNKAQTKAPPVTPQPVVPAPRDKHSERSAQ